jgi:NAD(P)-dependent dehydrogenase (short-subunit alcohol dehydrogenase family)
MATIVVIGASGGIGRYLMMELARDHRTVGTFCNHNPVASDWLPVYRQSVGTDPELYHLDLVEDSLDAFAGGVVGPQTVLINAAGISKDSMGHRLRAEHWDSVMDVNLRGAFLAAKAFLPHMREAGWGRIVNLCSVVGQKGVPGTSAYAASKAGLEGLTRTLAIENAGKGITVNALTLGYMTVGMINVLPAESQEKIKDTIPMKRFGHPQNVAAAIRFLIEADYVTGATININGGLL